MTATPDELAKIEVVDGDSDYFAKYDWRWFGSLDCDEESFAKLRSCCGEHHLEVKLGTDGVDIWCDGAHHDIAYGMFCMLQHELDG